MLSPLVKKALLLSLAITAIWMIAFGAFSTFLMGFLGGFGAAASGIIFWLFVFVLLWVLLRPGVQKAAGSASLQFRPQIYRMLKHSADLFGSRLTPPLV